jgi:hypothetical protein
MDEIIKNSDALQKLNKESGPGTADSESKEK